MKRSDKIEKDIKVLEDFFGVYCRKNHNSKNGELCDECKETLQYAIDRIRKCKLNPKPSCRKCPVHCFKDEYRQRIRKVMRYSGIYYVKRGRIDWLIKHFWL